MINILIVAICILPVLGWFLFRKKVNIRLLNIYGIISVILPLGLLYCFTLATKLDRADKMSASMQESNKEEKWQLVQRLAENKSLIGKDTNQIKGILGNPDIQADSLNQWYYNMGTEEYGMGWRFHSLLITFQSAKVARVDYKTSND